MGGGTKWGRGGGEVLLTLNMIGKGRPKQSRPFGKLASIRVRRTPRELKKIKSKCLIDSGFCFLVFQLCSIISSTHQDGAERNGWCYTLWKVEQGSRHRIVALPKLFYAKRIAVVLTSYKHVPWFCLPEMIFFLFSFYLMALYSAVWADCVLCFFNYYYCYFDSNDQMRYCLDFWWLWLTS